MNKLTLPSAVVICTLNRPKRIKALLGFLESLRSSPRCVVVVDSSPSGETGRVVEDFAKRTPFRLVYLKTQNGAAHQKNMGLDYLEEHSDKNLEVVHFLDDDVIPAENYFETCLELFRLYETAAIIGGYDRSLERPRASFLRDLAGLSRGDDNGVVLRSGICIVPFPQEQMQEVQFVPGGMLSVRWFAIKGERFDGRVRIYGDEVELQLRLRTKGKIFSSHALPVLHHSEKAAKDSQRVEQGYMDGFRWALSIKYPSLVSARKVILTTIFLIVGEAGRALFRRDSISWLRLMGHLDFFLRLARRQHVQQYVRHSASGPFVNDLRI